MPKRLKLAKRRFGRLLVQHEAGRSKSGHILWECVCDCGNKIITSSNALIRGDTQSCGCLQKERATKANITHGLSRTLEYRIWASMKGRCLNPDDAAYTRYGKRGITVCERWMDFANFYADMGKKTKGLTLERKNNELGYFKENCCWDTYTQQSRNKRLYKRNTSGISGVYWKKSLKKYLVYIRTNYKQIYLGAFQNLIDAAKARQNAEIKYWGKIQTLLPTKTIS